MEKFDRQRKQFLITQNNPSDYGITSESIIETIHHKFHKQGIVYWCMSMEQEVHGSLRQVVAYIKRDVRFYYHVGEPGMGKSFSYVHIVAQHPNDG